MAVAAVSGRQFVVCPHIVGTAHSRDGRLFFVLKNSYGRTGRFGGYLLMDENYFRMKTLAVYRRTTH